MAKSKKSDRSFTIVYDEQHPFPTIAVTGAHGGPVPDGSAITCNFYVEGGTIPAMEEYQANDEGKFKLGEGGSILKRADVTRRVVAAIVISPEGALRLGKWLTEKGKLAQKMREANPV